METGTGFGARLWMDLYTKKTITSIREETTSEKRNVHDYKCNDYQEILVHESCFNSFCQALEAFLSISIFKRNIWQNLIPMIPRTVLCNIIYKKLLVTVCRSRIQSETRSQVGPALVARAMVAGIERESTLKT